MSVFEDNAGVVRFDDEYDVCFKVETHNHPSAIEPYGGANTGLGGVIRDPLGTGLGPSRSAIPSLLLAPPDTPPEDVPGRRASSQAVMKGVVAGVRDYGNRMGIPTVNGAVASIRATWAIRSSFAAPSDCSPRGKCRKTVEPGDLIVAVGGRTGRDGIHGATFCSIELTARAKMSPAARSRSATPSPRRRCST